MMIFFNKKKKKKKKIYIYIYKFNSYNRNGELNCGHFHEKHQNMLFKF